MTANNIWLNWQSCASDTRDPRFESSEWKNILNTCLLSTVLKKLKYLFIVSCIEKTKMMKKRPRMAIIFKIIRWNEQRVIEGYFLDEVFPFEASFVMIHLNVEPIQSFAYVLRTCCVRVAYVLRINE